MVWTTFKKKTRIGVSDIWQISRLIVIQHWRSEGNILCNLFRTEQSSSQYNANTNKNLQNKYICAKRILSRKEEKITIGIIGLEIMEQPLMNESYKIGCLVRQKSKLDRFSKSPPCTKLHCTPLNCYLHSVWCVLMNYTT